MVKMFDFAFMTLTSFPFTQPHDIMPSIMEKTKQTYALPILKECHSTIASFDLWMLKGVHDVFFLVIIFLRSD
jgi:hypothetical protein